MGRFGSGAASRRVRGADGAPGKERDLGCVSGQWAVGSVEGGAPARVLFALSSGKTCPAPVMPKACLNKAPPDEQDGERVDACGDGGISFLSTWADKSQPYCGRSCKHGTSDALSGLQSRQRSREHIPGALPECRGLRADIGSHDRTPVTRGGCAARQFNAWDRLSSDALCCCVDPCTDIAMAVLLYEIVDRHRARQRLNVARIRRPEVRRQ